MTRTLLWLAPLVVALLAPPAPAAARRAKRVRATPVAKVKVKQSVNAPTFTPTSRPRIVNRGAHLYLGRGLYGEHQRLFLMDAQRGGRHSVVAPVDAFVARFPHRFSHRARRFSRLTPYVVQKLLYYDTRNHEAGVLMAEASVSRQARYFHLHWDLRRGRITRADLLGSRGPSTYWVSVKRIGYDPTRREAYLQIVSRIRGAGAATPRRHDGARRRARYRRQSWGKPRYRVRVVAVGRKGLRTVAAFETKRKLSRGPFHDPLRRRVLLVEYAERGRHHPRPTGYVVDLATRRVRKLPIPLTTYGAAFTPDGKALLLYGSQRGVLWRFDLTAWRVTRRARIGALGHGVGFPFPDTLLVLRHKILHLVDPVTLREKQRLRTSQFYGGFSHIEGSVVGAGVVWLRNKPWIHLIQLTR